MVYKLSKEKIERLWGGVMDLKITYSNGKMIIRMNTFFPTSQARFKKLLKVIDLDFAHRDEHIQTLEQYFNEKVQELEEKRISSGKKVLDYKQKVVDITTIIKDRKHPNGVRLTKEELEQAKEDQKHFKAVQAGCTSEFNRCIRQKEQFLKHLEILEQVR